jgi:hypothetical protein
VRNPDIQARNVLQGIYYAQRDYETKNHRWAASRDELGLSSDIGPGLVGTPSVRLTSAGFEAAVEVRPPGGTIERWHIRQDARVWKE